MIWILSTIALASPGCPDTVSALPASPLYDAADPRLTAGPLIVVFKADRRLAVYHDGQRRPEACWTAALAHGYVPGHKQRRGDLRTPEGWSIASDRPWSSYYGALTVHYPGPADATRGLAAGLVTQAQHDAIVEAHRTGAVPPMNTRLGGQIVIHGGGGEVDWTLGCVALGDTDIDALRALLPDDKRSNLLILP